MVSPHWCSADCGKHTVTADDGSFALEGLAPNMQFTVRAEARGYEDLTLPGGALTTPLLFALQQRVVENYGISGIVLAPNGSRAAGAVVTVRGYEALPAGAKVQAARGNVAQVRVPVVVNYDATDQQGPDYQRQATADNEGRFHLRGSSAWRGVVVVSASTGANVRGQLHRLKPGTDDNRLRLVAGSTIVGRVLYKSLGVGGVVVGATPIADPNPRLAANRGVTTWAATEQAVTDETGRFAIEHVEPGRIYCLFLPMRSLAERELGAIAQEVRTGADGESVEAGELNLHPAHKVSGQVVFAGGNPLRLSSISIALERPLTHDVQETRLDDEGRFVLRGVPSESVILSFHEPSSKKVFGFRLSPHNKSLDPAHRVLCGRVDEDRQLLVVFEPGASEPYTPGEPLGIATRAVRNGVATIVSAPRETPLMGAREDTMFRTQRKGDSGE